MAKTTIDETMDAALNAIRRLDAIVLNEFHNDSAKTALWENMRRVENRRGKPVGATTAAAAATATAAAAPVLSEAAGV